MTTGNETVPIVDGTDASAQIRSAAGTIAAGGAKKTARAIARYEKWAIIRPWLYQATMPVLRWRNWPIGIARRNPLTAGIAVSRPMWNAEPPRRATNTGRNVEAALMMPIATESQRMTR